MSAAAHPGRALSLAAALVLALCLALAAPAAAGPPAVTTLGKADLARLVGPRLRKVVRGGAVAVYSPRLGPITLQTTIIPALQRQAERILSGARSRRAAMVVVEAGTGKVLALAGVKRRRRDPRVALDSRAPAASLIKVVTAAAALEEISLSPGSRLSFIGRPHTLYRYQLRKKLRRKPRTITLSDSFAKSNNPVFARLGIHRLGSRLLTWYGRALGFDRRIPFEAPLGTSRLFKPKTDFQVGELACGYARTTTISPLHAALMISVFINGGHFMEPYMVAKAIGAGGEILYVGRPKATGSLVSPRTRRGMRRLMRATITKGTARRAFRRLNRDRVLRDLQLGGKTGTLRGLDRKELYEWFAGYARDPLTGRSLAVCTLVVHGSTRWCNPKKMARRMIRDAFRIIKHKPTRVAAKR